MRWIARVDRDDKCRIEKQPNVGVEPAVAQIARTEHAAIATRIVRLRAAVQHDEEAGKPEDQATHLSSLFRTQSGARFDAPRRPASPLPPLCRAGRGMAPKWQDQRS